MHPGCSEGDIRLAEGATKLEGRVEICKNNMWGTVCHSYWGKPDATVVCRQLGLSVAGIIHFSSQMRLLKETSHPALRNLTSFT